MENGRPESWLKTSREENRKLFSELNALLKALDRFLNVENLPGSRETVVTKNFHNELRAVRDVTLRILGILDVVIPDRDKNIYWFQRFTEAKFMSDRKRDFIRNKVYKHDTPEKDIYLLYDFFTNLKGILTDLLKSDHISFSSFVNVGQITSRELRENTEFNPFKKDLDPEYDTITKKAITDIVKGIGDREMKKVTSIIFLHLFKFIRYLGFIDISSSRLVSLNCSVLILVLLRSEIEAFLTFIERATKKIKDEELKSLLQAVSFQLTMETKRVYLQELRDVLTSNTPQQIRGKVENSHGILKNLTEQSIMQLATYWREGVDGHAIFASYTTRLEESLRLREDIIVLHKIVGMVEKAASQQERATLMQSLINFMAYFESFTFKLLRYDDYEAFLSFFTKITMINSNGFSGEASEKTTEEFSRLKIFLETNIMHISNRSELRDRPLDDERIDVLIQQYISSDIKEE